MVKDYLEQSQEMFEKAGFTNIKVRDTHSPPGSDLHEVGGVRMGDDPKNSLLNKWNQLHLCKNVFVSDGACMVSTGTQNPTLTFMSLTARAANYAVEELKRKNLQLGPGIQTKAAVSLAKSHKVLRILEV